jgi:hypothetical protein
VISKDGKELVEIVKGKPFKNDDPDDGNQMAMMMGRKSEGSRFAYLPKEKEVVVISNPLSQASTRASDWLDKAFVKISDLKSISLGEGGKDVWTLSRESATADWKLEGAIPENMEFDKQAASSLASSLSWTTFSDVAGIDKAKPSSPRQAARRHLRKFRRLRLQVRRRRGEGRQVFRTCRRLQARPFVAKKDSSRGAQEGTGRIRQESLRGQREALQVDEARRRMGLRLRQIRLREARRPQGQAPHEEARGEEARNRETRRQSSRRQ